MTKGQLKKVRAKLLKEITALLPDQKELVDYWMPYCAGIHTIDGNGEISCYSLPNTYAPTTIQKLPLDALVELKYQLKDRTKLKRAKNVLQDT